jgi:Fuc2NAc and GlcNAc transferase
MDGTDGITEFPIAAAAACAGVTAVATLALRAWLVAAAVVDAGTQRGLHTGQVPRGGGIAFAAVALVSLVAVRPGLPCTDAAAIAMVVAAIAVAVVGAIDDVRGLPALPRLAVHLAAGATVAYACVAGSEAPWSGIEAAALAAGITLACAWSINLNNFMDGIDGICAAHGTLVIGGAGAFAWHHGDTGLAFACAVLAGSIAGFLPLNVSRGFRIFMGDAGSGFLGLAMAATLALAWKSGAMSAWSALILPSVFATDATVTLVRRAVRGERLATAHCSHAFQHLAKRAGRHGPVTALYAGITAGWALTMAIAASAWPENAAWIVCLAYAPLIAAALLLRAGMPDRVNPLTRGIPH